MKLKKRNLSLKHFHKVVPFNDLFVDLYPDFTILMC